MTHLLLIRHGETLWNRQGRFQGSADIALSELGRAQARRLAESLADKHLDAIYSSPLSRALDTAKAVAAPHGLEVQVVDDLAEINVGEWSGKTWAEIHEIWPELAKNWRVNPLDSGPPPGGKDTPTFAAAVWRPWTISRGGTGAPTRWRWSATAASSGQWSPASWVSPGRPGASSIP